MVRGGESEGMGEGDRGPAKEGNNGVTGNETYSERVREVLLRQPLNPLVKLEFVVNTKR